MVNVPGGSKACGNCKRRKVKCDECRPACKRCEKARLLCDGYALPLIRVYGSKTARWPTETSHSTRPAAKTPNQTTPAFDRALLLPRETVHLHFLSALIYREVLENDIPLKGQPWVMAIMAHERTGVASQAASALAAVHFAGLYDCSAQDMAFARIQYAGAIQTLSKNLADQELSHDVGNTAAVLFLFWCEIATGAMNGHAYTQHNEGLARVVEHIGPHGHQTWLARKNFNMSRMNIIFFTLQQRKRTFLEHSDWKTIPWATTWIPKTPMQKLLDIAADVPGLLENADALHQQGICRDTSFLHKLLQDRILSTLTLLCQWGVDWHCLHPEAASVVNVESHLHCTLLRAESRALPTSVWFHDFARAHEIAIYHAVLIVLLDLAFRHVDIHSIQECISIVDAGGLELDKTPLLLPYPGITTLEIVEEVFRTVNYFLHGEHRASGALAVYYALWACQVVLNPDNDSDDGSLWERLRLLVRSQPRATEQSLERAAI